MVKNNIKEKKDPKKVKKITANAEDSKGIQRGIKDFQEGKFIDFDEYLASQKD